MDNGDIAKGFLLGAAAVLIGRVLLKSVPASGQPIAHALLRGGAVLAEKAREAAAELGEVLEDTLAELHATDAAATDATSHPAAVVKATAAADQPPS
jgi:hypothetical protein